MSHNHPPKKKLATVWLAGCSGCHMSFLDIDERMLEIAKWAEVVKSPIVDGKEFPDCDIALIEGSIASEEHRDEIRHIRKKAKLLVAFGDCAVTGNVSGLRNLVTREDALKRSYIEAESNENGAIPRDKEVSQLLESVSPLHDYVKVDYFIPGCPPSADVIFHVLKELLHDRIPEIPESKLKYG